MESSLAESKSAYSLTLRALERISDEIHQKRQENQQTRKRISLHDELNHFVSGSKKTSNETTMTAVSGTEQESIEVKKNERAELCLSASAASAIQDNRRTEQNQTDNVDCSLKTIQNDLVTMKEMSSKANAMPMTPQAPDNAIQPTMGFSKQPALVPLVTPNKNELVHKVASGSHTLSKIPAISLTVQPAESHCAQDNRLSIPEAILDPSLANAEVMRSIMRLKSASISPPVSFVNYGLNHLGDENSDKDSITSSFVNANVLSDEQIESLMLEPADYKKTLESMNPAELGQFKGLELPAKLNYLQDYVKFDPIWIEDDFDNFDKKAGKFVITESNHIAG